MGVKIAIAFPDKGDTHSFTTESFQMGDWVFRVPHGFRLIAMLDIILMQFISSESMLWEEMSLELGMLEKLDFTLEHV